MDILQQLQNVYYDLSSEIRINCEVAKTITLSDVCIIIDSNSTLFLDDDITDYFIEGMSCFYVTKNFENMAVVIMLFIIFQDYIAPDKYFYWNSEKFRFDCSEFRELAKHFGVKYDPDTKKIIKILDPNKFKYDPQSSRNIENYLGLSQAMKSARALKPQHTR